MLNVLQLTDTHIFSNSDGELYGVNTRQSLQAVIDDIKNRCLDYDVLLVTGDLVHDEGEEAYDLLERMLSQLNVPTYYLPGNHDSATVMEMCLPNSTKSGLLSFTMQDWQIVMLDSSMPGKVEGNIDEMTLAKLKTLLDDETDKNILVAVHHQPVSTQSLWMDRIGINNGEELMSLLVNYPQVKLIINGHIHQSLSVDVGHVRALGTPSTCAQFKPNVDEAGIDDAPPGYRTLELKADGSFSTKVYRL